MAQRVLARDQISIFAIVFSQLRYIDKIDLFSAVMSCLIFYTR